MFGSSKKQNEKLIFSFGEKPNVTSPNPNPNSTGIFGSGNSTLTNQPTFGTFNNNNNNPFAAFNSEIQVNPANTNSTNFFSNGGDNKPLTTLSTGFGFNNKPTTSTGSGYIQPLISTTSNTTNIDN